MIKKTNIKSRRTVELLQQPELIEILCKRINLENLLTVVISA